MLRHHISKRLFCASKNVNDNLSIKDMLNIVKFNPSLSKMKVKYEEVLNSSKQEKETKSLPYLKSLFYERRNPEDLNYNDMIMNNQMLVHDQIYKNEIVLKNLTDKEKQRIHLMIDMKMQEIEDSGLSRSEISGREG